MKNIKNFTKLTFVVSLPYIYYMFRPKMLEFDKRLEDWFTEPTEAELERLKARRDKQFKHLEK